MTNETLQQELRNPPRYFAACASRPGCPHKAECLRAMAWEKSEKEKIWVLRKDTCRFLPVRTVILKKGFRGLGNTLTQSQYQNFRSGVMQYMSRITLWRIQSGRAFASVEQGNVIEAVWHKYTQEPFPWLETEEVLCWSP